MWFGRYTTAYSSNVLNVKGLALDYMCLLSFYLEEKNVSKYLCKASQGWQSEVPTKMTVTANPMSRLLGFFSLKTYKHGTAIV